MNDHNSGFDECQDSSLHDISSIREDHVSKADKHQESQLCRLKWDF